MKGFRARDTLTNQVYRRDCNGDDKVVRGLLASRAKARRGSELAKRLGIAQLAKCLIDRDMNGAIGIVISLLFNPPIYNSADGKNLSERRGRTYIGSGGPGIEARNQKSGLVSELCRQLSRQLRMWERSLYEQKRQGMQFEEELQDNFWDGALEMSIHV
ncbi:hypothetical protein THAOC_32266, partial [Thalassiosira oceanica]